MKKSEEEALKAFPPRMEFPSMVSAATGNKVDTNEISRNVFIKGYEQAMKDLLEDYGDYVVTDDGAGIAHPLHFAQLGARWQNEHMSTKHEDDNKTSYEEITSKIAEKTLLRFGIQSIEDLTLDDLADFAQYFVKLGTEKAKKSYCQVAKQLEQENTDYSTINNLEDAARTYASENTMLPEYRNNEDVPKYVENTVDVFKAGAHWQREHVWHDPDEEPDIDCKIMWEDENHLGKNLSAGQWKAKKDVFGRKERWCYVRDILPTKKR